LPLRYLLLILKPNYCWQKLNSEGGLQGATTTQQYYEAGVRAAMDEWALFPGTFSPAVSNTEKDNYLLGPAVAYNDANALNLINTQYWIECYDKRR
jgi:hypothetical protein